MGQGRSASPAGMVMSSRTTAGNVRLSGKITTNLYGVKEQPVSPEGSVAVRWNGKPGNEGGGMAWAGTGWAGLLQIAVALQAGRRMPCAVTGRCGWL